LHWEAKIVARVEFDQRFGELRGQEEMEHWFPVLRSEAERQSVRWLAWLQRSFVGHVEGLEKRQVERAMGKLAAWQSLKYKEGEVRAPVSDVVADEVDMEVPT
jgi:hypothetical protein